MNAPQQEDGSGRRPMELRDIIEAANNDPRQVDDQREAAAMAEATAMAERWPPQRPVTSAGLEEDLRQLATDLVDQREPFRFSPRATALAERLFNGRVRRNDMGAIVPEGEQMQIRAAQDPEALPTDMTFGLQSTPPPAALTFHVGDEPMIEFMQDGRIYIRGQLVDNNQEVYAALLDWLQTVGQYPQGSEDYRNREGLNKPEPPEPGRTRFDILKEGQP